MSVATPPRPPAPSPLGPSVRRARRTSVPKPAQAAPGTAGVVAAPDAPPFRAPALAAPARFSLDVVSGLQCGARVSLSPGREITVGQDEGDDVRLRDPCAAGARIAIGVNDDGVTVRPLAGVVRAADRELAADGATRWSPGEPLLLGDVALGIDVLNAPVTTESAVHIEPTAAARDALDAHALTTHGEAEPAKLRPGGGRVLARAGALALAGLALVSAWWFGTRSLVPNHIAPIPIAMLLQGPAFAGLTVDEDQHEGRVAIHGVVADRAALKQLSALLADRGQNVLNRVETDASLATKVLDVLRVNGAEATLVSSERGDVVIDTVLPAARDVQALADLVKDDVPALGTLTLNNEPPPSAPDPGSRPDAGKRVAMVVSANPAHVITDDQSRYFVGSLLPSGHRIIAIADNRVSLERDGERTTLDF